MNIDVAKFLRFVRRHPRTLLSRYDDAGGIFFESQKILIKVDGFALSRALYPWCNYSDFGFRAITAAVSDVYAKGCQPYLYAVSIGLPEDRIDIIEDIVKGVYEAVDLYGGYIENVDTNVGKDGWMDVFVLAVCDYMPLPRDQRVSDFLVLPRKIGLTTIAYLEHYQHSRTPRDPEVCSFVCKPTTPSEILQVIQRFRSGITGSIDISDTFADTLYDLTMASGHGIYIHVYPNEVAHNKLLSYSSIDSDTLLRYVLLANEEYIPLLIVNPSYVEAIIDELEYLGFESIVIGRAISGIEILWRGISVPRLSWSHRYSRIVEDTQ